MLHSLNPGPVGPANQPTANGLPGPSNLAGYVEGSDLHQSMLWDSPENAALSKLFDKARNELAPPSAETSPASCQWLLELAAHAAPSTILSFPEPAEVPPQNRKTYTLADLDYEFFGLETVMQVSSYEKLLRTTSYKMLEARLSGVDQIPLSESNLFDVSLQKVVNSADLCLKESPAQAPQANLSRQRIWRAPARALARSRRLRMLDAHVESRTSWWFGAGDARDVLQNVWDRFVSRKNASLMLDAMRRRIKLR